MKKAVIELKDVWRIYHMGEVQVPAVKGLDLIVEEGDFITIMGSSGSGKSTTVNMIGCLDKPTKGHIFLGGKDISKMPESELAQVRGKMIGFVFQQFNLLKTMTALENVMVPMIFQNMPKAEREKRATELLVKVGLGHRLNHRPSEMSGGEQQRIAIARALANNPEIILADEPTGNLDSTTGKMIMQLLIDLHEKEGKTIVVITHDPYIAKYAHKIYLLKDGKFIRDHTEEKVYEWTEKK